MVYVGTISTFVGFFAWYRGLAEAGVARASQVQLVQPLLTIVWTVPLLGDSLDPAALITAAAVGACVLVTQRARQGALAPAARCRGWRVGEPPRVAWAYSPPPAPAMN